MKSRTRIASVLAIASLAVGVAVSQQVKLPVNWKDLPDPFHTPSARNRPQVVERPDEARLALPAGFAIEEFSSGGYIRPRFMVLGPNQEVILSDSGAREERNGAVYVLDNGSKKKIVENLDRPFGLALHEKWLYVAETTSLKRYVYDPRARAVTGAGEEIVSLKGFGRGHWTRTILFNADHSKFYLTVGSGSNIDVGEDPMRAALHRYNPDGSGHETVATGLRNIIGLRWAPGADDLWAAVQERDGLGDDLVADYLVKIRQGGFYGWPYAYSGPHEEPRHKGVAPEMVKKTLYPDVLLDAHVAVLDSVFYTGEQFPEKYRGGLFLAYHGSWNRARRIGYKIVYIPFEDGRPTAGAEDFLTGWMLDPTDRRVWGRPVGLLQMPDGSLLVSDDGGLKIWRISYKG